VDHPRQYRLCVGTASISATGGEPAAHQVAPPAPSPELEQVDCPRCGYDQSGVITGFRRGKSSPLQGRCSECGLDWFWGDLLHPARQLPNWFLENLKRWALPVLISTWLRALLPRRFWGTILLTFPIRHGRLVLYALLALMMSYLIAAVASGLWEIYATQGRFMATWGSMWSSVNWRNVLASAAVPIGPGDRWSSSLLAHFTVVATLWVMLMPLPFLLLRQTFTRVRVRRAHLARIWVYSLSLLPLLLGGVCLFRLGVKWLQTSVMYIYPQNTLQRITSESTIAVLRGEWIIVVLVGAWLALFWGRAVGTYLRLPNARAVVSLLMLASFLAALAIGTYYPGSLLVQSVGCWFWY